MNTGDSIVDEVMHLTERDRFLTENNGRLLPLMVLWDALMERESKAIADELHNDIGQVLTALKLNISVFQLQNQADAEMVEKMKTFLALTDHSLQKVSGLIDVLRSANYEQGLETELEHLCQRFSKRYNLPCALSVIGRCSSVDLSRKRVIFRVLHEALNNVAQHAMARSASITINQTVDKVLHIEIRDDGCGFSLPYAGNGKNLGFSIMQESISALGGVLDIQTEKNYGTTVALNIPLL